MVTKEQIAKDLVDVNEIFKKEFPDAGVPVTRNFYREHGKYSEKDLTKVFGSFKLAVKFCKLSGETGYSRDTISVEKTVKYNSKRYIVTSFVTGQEPCEAFIKNIEFYAKEKDAEVIFLLTKGYTPKAEISNKHYEKYSKYFATTITFNENLKAADFKILPQMIVPKTGLDEIDNRCSYIVASPKLSLETIPNRINEYPHLIWTPGAVTLPEYADDRQGKIAMEHHTIGGLIVEVVNNKKFHIRNIIADDEGGFVDLGVRFHNNKMKKVKSEAVLGDIHVGVECPIAMEKTIEIINQLDCKKIYINDLFDAQSVNPHVEKNLKAKYMREHHQNSLNAELTYLGEFIKDFSKKTKNKEIVVIPSNHDFFVDRYLNEGKFVMDSAQNAKLACELFVPHLDDINPIYHFLKSRKYLDKVKVSFPKRNDKLESFSYSIIHGDRGTSGMRGSVRSFTKCYGKNIVGHSHTPCIFKYTVQVGTLSLLDQFYIEGFGSGWMHTSAFTYENGTFQLISIIDGEWKIAD